MDKPFSELLEDLKSAAIDTECHPDGEGAEAVYSILRQQTVDYVAGLDARLKEQEDLLTKLKDASIRVSLPEYIPVEASIQSDGTWWMDLESGYASVDLDRGGFIGVDGAKSRSETMSGQFHWGDLEELDVFLTLLLASRKTYIEKGVARYRAETGL
jgi:hypothetical protein